MSYSYVNESRGQVTDTCSNAAHSAMVQRRGSDINFLLLGLKLEDVLRDSLTALWEARVLVGLPDEYNVSWQCWNLALASPAIGLAVPCPARHTTRQFGFGARFAASGTERRLRIKSLWSFQWVSFFQLWDVGGRRRIRTFDTLYFLECGRFQNGWLNPLAQPSAH